MKLPAISLGDLQWAKDNREAVKRLALKLHEGQVDKGGTPYHKHLEYVASKQDSLVGEVLAWMHDAIEEGKITREELLASGFPLSIVMRLEILAKRDTQSYEDYVHEVAQDRYTRYVKIMDLDHNLQLGRLQQWDNRLVPMIKKYMYSIQYLREYDRAAQESIA